MSMKRATVASSTTTEQEDKPIGSGSFGVVWDVLDDRNGKRVALKKITNIFDSRRTAIRVFRELRMLSTFQHENVLAALEVLKPPSMNRFKEVFVITELLHSDLKQVLWFRQPLSADQIHILVYQMLRGLKYIHSAKIIHRDIKPANLLINNNCLLKICDFSLARAEVTDQSRKMTLDLVTKGYRAPEIFLGTRHYTGAVDIWSAACVFAELLSNRVLFKPLNHVRQIDQMMDLLGTPSMSDIDYASKPMKELVARSRRRPSRVCTLYDLSPYATADAVDLLSRMLNFNPTKRISAAAALEHPYMVRGRELFHLKICKCCSEKGAKMEEVDLEPDAPEVFDDLWEQEITSVEVAKEKIHQFIKKRLLPEGKGLHINPDSKIFKKVGWEDFI